MKWKEYKPKPRFPRPEMQTTIISSAQLVDDPDIKNKTLVHCEQCVLSLWPSQLEQVATIMSRYEFKKNVKILWKVDPANNKYVIATEVEENID